MDTPRFLRLSCTALGLWIGLAAPAAAELTACALITDDEAKAFAGADFDRDAGSPTSCSIDTMKDGVYNRYLFLSLEQFEAPPGMKLAMAEFAKDMVESSSANEESDGGKRLKCKVAGATHFACFDVASPAGSFAPGQRAALVMVGKGKSFVRLTLFHDERPNLELATELAAKIHGRLP